MCPRRLQSPTVLVCIAILFVGSANISLAQSGGTKHRIEALLGARDTVVSAEQWRVLGEDAGAILEAIASDPNTLPTKRARAIEGITALATVHANELLMRFAHAEDEPEVLRMAAVRGLGRALPSWRLIEELRPILKSSREQHLRGWLRKSSRAIRQDAWKFKSRQSMSLAHGAHGFSRRAPASRIALHRPTIPKGFNQILFPQYRKRSRPA